MKKLLLTTAIILSFSAPAFAGVGHDEVKTDDHGGHGEMKADDGHGDDHAEMMMVGMPGDSAKVDRTIDVLLLENDDGEMLIQSEELNIKKGETILFKVKNVGELEHEFVLDTVENNEKHKMEMSEMAGMDMGHVDPNRITLEAGASGEVVWSFMNAGTFEAACLIPGHYESGMFREVAVGG
tara:strand:+ start:2472 stop:3017 length:546 start_codon:yes stop_codon:yes gene_type:complete